VRPLLVASIAASGALSWLPSLELAPAPSSLRSTNALPVVETVAREVPGGRPVARVGTAAPWAGSRARLLVLSSRVDERGERWLRVRLPRRPNGAEGWIPRDRVELVGNRWRVEVSLARRELVVRRDGALVRRDRAGVGADVSPTPRGVFAVTETFRTTQPGVGPWAIALTAFSDVYTSFAGGPGLVAIHGGSVHGGTNGCITVAPAALRWLARSLPAGTPVVVT
jgi:hypothetical protein